ncbi:MAG: type II toxin-antitoxin system HicB family antitoxin [Proteobacteria bacterium]|nr:type II toxin-antitoxin system HicB family antitoxin [Pseudomonadota bacterium]
MADEDKKQLTLRIPQEVHKKLRILAALHDQTMTDYFIELVEVAYRKESKDTGPVQLKLPT